jgi:hypothetical protein
MMPSLKGSSDPFSGTGTLPSEYLTVPDAEKFSRGQKQLERNQGELRTVYPDLNDQSTFIHSPPANSGTEERRRMGILPMVYEAI